MKFQPSTLLVVCLIAMTCFSYAESKSDFNQTLHIYISNHARSNLKFERIINSNDGNYFTVAPTLVQPGETMHIIAVKNVNADIAANLLFDDGNGHEAILFILDQEQVHMGQPVFNVKGPGVYSVLVSKTRNTNIGPRYLTYVQANLQVSN